MLRRRDPAFPLLTRLSGPSPNLCLLLILFQGNAPLLQRQASPCWRAPSARAPTCGAARRPCGRASAGLCGDFQGERNRKSKALKRISRPRHPTSASGEVSQFRRAPVARGHRLLSLQGRVHGEVAAACGSGSRAALGRARVRGEMGSDASRACRSPSRGGSNALLPGVGATMP